MPVARLSLTPVKGTAHAHPAELVVEAGGPRHDRRFCLVDPQRSRVLRTVENPALVGCHAWYDGAHLSVRLPGGTTAAGDVVRGGAGMTVDYWGRPVQVAVVRGPWAAAFSALLGHEVVLTEVSQPGDVVFGASVTLLTTSSLRELGRRLGRPAERSALSDQALDDSERFRSTVVVDTGPAPAFVEDGWVGRQVLVGSAVVQVTGAVPRCAVVRIAPGEGRVDDMDPLRALAVDRTELNARGREVVFGVQGDVVRPGLVSTGDAVHVRAALDPSR